MSRNILNIFARQPTKVAKNLYAQQTKEENKRLLKTKKHLAKELLPKAYRLYTDQIAGIRSLIHSNQAKVQRVVNFCKIGKEERENIPECKNIPDMKEITSLADTINTRYAAILYQLEQIEINIKNAGGLKEQDITEMTVYEKTVKETNSLLTALPVYHTCENDYEKNSKNSLEFLIRKNNNTSRKDKANNLIAFLHAVDSAHDNHQVKLHIENNIFELQQALQNLQHCEEEREKAGRLKRLFRIAPSNKPHEEKLDEVTRTAENCLREMFTGFTTLPKTIFNKLSKEKQNADNLHVQFKKVEKQINDTQIVIPKWKVLLGAFANLVGINVSWSKTAADITTGSLLSTVRATAKAIGHVMEVPFAPPAPKAKVKPLVVIKLHPPKAVTIKTLAAANVKAAPVAVKTQDNIKQNVGKQTQVTIIKTQTAKKDAAIPAAVKKQGIKLPIPTEHIHLIRMRS